MYSMHTLEDKTKKVAGLLKKSCYAVVLTGAGISTESGIPDFRSPGSGLWNKVDPAFFTIEGFRDDPARFYKFRKEFFYAASSARPNKAHTALGRLQEMGLVKTIITQNIDGLHQKGGAVRVLEIHGNMNTASCVSCHTRRSMSEVIREVEEGQLPPLCPGCGDSLKPDVILFGEAMPPDYQVAIDEARKADLIIVIGSSMQVSPANMLPDLCEDLVIINRTPTFYDQQARIAIHDTASCAMVKILKYFESGS